MIDPHSDRAVYRQIADDLRIQITSGHIGPGEMLPSGTRLRQEYGVATGTIRRALEVLVKEGLIVVEASYGQRVRDRPQRQKVPVPRGASVISRPASLDEQRRLGIPEGAHVQEITLGGRVRGVYPADSVELTIA